MSSLCALLAYVITLGFCSDKPTPYDTGYLPAIALRTEVQKSVEISNQLLERSGRDWKFVTDWSTEGDVGHDSENVLTVYLVRSRARLSAVQASIDKTKKIVENQLAHDHQVLLEYDNCTDADDCVEKLYVNNSSKLAIQTLSNIFETEIAKTQINCNCVVLFEDDLIRFKEMFTSYWDSFLLSIRFDSEAELKEAIEQDKVPHMLLDSIEENLFSFIPLFLLHEMGHFDRTFKPTTIHAFDDQIDSMINLGLNSSKYEEIRADLFASDVYFGGCFSENITKEIQKTCVNGSTISMMIFAWTLTGKSKEARCLRYLDRSKTHPNLQLRFLIRDLYMSRDSESAKSLLSDFLNIRSQISSKSWINEVSTCKNMTSATYSERTYSHDF